MNNYEINPLEDLLSAKKDHTVDPRPDFFKLSNEVEQKKLHDLLNTTKDISIIDTYDTQLKELFVLNNPWLHLNHEQRDKEFEQYRNHHYQDKEEWKAGVWVYLPWRNVLIHTLEDDGYQQVRTARNRNLITPEEQKKFYNSVIGIAGQSVGNSVTLSIVQTGGGKHMRLADPDTLELTNLNRIRGSIAEITNYKVYMAARQIYELDPYAKLDLFTDGLTEENIEKFFDGPPKLDIVIDEIDQLGMKIRIRQEAKKRGIPVVMAADNGESGVLDVERYDLDPNIPLFHGRAGDDIADRVLGKQPPLPIIGKIIGEELIGFDILERRVQESLLEIGKSIPTWPQLGSAALLNGALVAATVRRIVTGQSVTDNRVNASVLSWLVPGYDSSEQVEQRKRETLDFAETYNKSIDEFLKKLG